jgi:hypothetical protein
MISLLFFELEEKMDISKCCCCCCKKNNVLGLVGIDYGNISLQFLGISFLGIK